MVATRKRWLWMAGLREISLSAEGPIKDLAAVDLLAVRLGRREVRGELVEVRPVGLLRKEPAFWKVG